MPRTKPFRTEGSHAEPRGTWGEEERKEASGSSEGWPPLLKGPIAHHQNVSQRLARLCLADLNLQDSLGHLFGALCSLQSLPHHPNPMACSLWPGASWVVRITSWLETVAFSRCWSFQSASTALPETGCQIQVAISEWGGGGGFNPTFPEASLLTVISSREVTHCYATVEEDLQKKKKHSIAQCLSIVLRQQHLRAPIPSAFGAGESSDQQKQTSSQQIFCSEMGMEAQRSHSLGAVWSGTCQSGQDTCRNSKWGRKQACRVQNKFGFPITHQPRGATGVGSEDQGLRLPSNAPEARRGWGPSSQQCEPQHTQDLLTSW